MRKIFFLVIGSILIMAALSLVTGCGSGSSSSSSGTAGNVSGSAK